MLNDKGADAPARSIARYIYVCVYTNINYRQMCCRLANENVQLSFGFDAIRHCGVCGCYSYTAASRLILVYLTEKQGSLFAGICRKFKSV